MDARGINRTFEEYDAAIEWSRAADADAVKISLPGFKREEIRVMVDNHGHLRTRGERPLAGSKWSRFQKDFQLPAECNVDGIRAMFENETLTITLPKKNPSPLATPLPPPMPKPAPPKPEPRRPATAPPQKPPPVLPEPAKPSPPPRAPVLHPAPSQKPVAERRPSLPRKTQAPEPTRPAPPMPAPAPAPEVESPKKYNGGAATTKPEPAAVLKPTEELVKETKKPLPSPEVAEEEVKRMEREARGKMEEDRKMVEEMEMAQRRRPISASRGLLVNVAVAVVVLVGITVYVWRSLRGGGGYHGKGELGTGSYSDEM